MGYCPFSSPGRDRQGLDAQLACMARSAAEQALSQQRQRERHGFLAIRSRHQILCRDTAEVGPGWSWVTTSFSCHDLAWP